MEIGFNGGWSYIIYIIYTIILFFFRRVASFLSILKSINFILNKLLYLKFWGFKSYGSNYLWKFYS